MARESDQCVTCVPTTIWQCQASKLSYLGLYVNTDHVINAMIQTLHSQLLACYS